MAIHRSGEDYLEAILMIRSQRGSCRSVDVARHLEVSKPSVSVAMGRLRDEGMVTLDEDGFLLLTPAGEAIASSIYERHCLLTDFFSKLGVPDEIAREDACKVEHDLSEETFSALKRFLGA